MFIEYATNCRGILHSGQERTDLLFGGQRPKIGKSDWKEVTMPEAVIVSSVRTPVGRGFKGSLRTSRPDDLAALVIKQALARVPDGTAVA